MLIPLLSPPALPAPAPAHPPPPPPPHNQHPPPPPPPHLYPPPSSPLGAAAPTVLEPRAAGNGTVLEPFGAGMPSIVGAEPSSTCGGPREGDGGVAAVRAVGTHEAMAVSRPRGQWKHTRQRQWTHTAKAVKVAKAAWKRKEKGSASALHREHDTYLRRICGDGRGVVCDDAVERRAERGGGHCQPEQALRLGPEVGQPLVGQPV